MFRVIMGCFFLMISGLVNSEPETASNTGVIRFSGAIVESPCRFDWRDNWADTTCWRKGHKIIQRRKLDLQNDIYFYLPHQIGVTEIKWIKGKEKIGVVTIFYN
ncbi:hypothetical protein GPY51_01680 [Photorhabdus laumondii subsp. laumondii]|uniref:Photorhabdus luminescens subsp. laumondii TTO1 complete genome segment 10/17 n=5 Tax=Morganellaceae TaxID=1903414 RepID=Q7N359_PHOLL|nr:hypothetical protein A4R40_14270 [Photorhabdus laumondii subsp. laumondii]MCC8384024.1 hypothetical protein [Photorhabdus laumondii]NHB61181.1 hypothetical protein [Photorhabdus sp. RW14-46]RAW75326.1 hypothetical protein CKY15_01630 [Photorhabdus sp. S7-51]RAW76851.1 hypothetical protein CKY14_00090 [Photorhabdus sp. S14-60]RAW80831.1 hypothetical protein CKY06_00090 [Photorhabdus sp. S15-56]RAW85908.1 hypothetical protein CKY09_09500 [Photorhabdus sp. S5P8-50]RAW86087.1 hypothetical pro